MLHFTSHIAGTNKYTENKRGSLELERGTKCTKWFTENILQISQLKT